MAGKTTLIALFSLAGFSRFVLMTLAASARPPTDAYLTVDLDTAILTTDERYLSLGMDSNLIRDRWKNFDFYSRRLMTLARGLSPAYLRLSGTDADRMIFDPNADNCELLASGGDKVHGNPPFPASNFTMTAQDWDNINKFCITAGWRLMFGLNAQLRNGPSWDPSNAIELLTHAIRNGYATNLDFQLGNEPNGYPGEKYLTPISATQLGKDVTFLRRLLDTDFQAYLSGSIIVGPDIGGDASGQFIVDYLRSVDADVLKAVTWHHYYGGGELKYVENYTDPALLDSYIKHAQVSVETVRKSAQPQVPVWQGETSSTVSPAGNGIEETFVAGFMLLDKLGLNAKLGMELFVRQTFYGFWFALVDDSLQPRPNYWIARLYKNLVGRHVLNASVSVAGDLNDSRVRMYAHCTARTGAYPDGTVTVFGMNLMDNDVTLHFSKTSGEDCPGWWVCLVTWNTQKSAVNNNSTEWWPNPDAFWRGPPWIATQKCGWQAWSHPSQQNTCFLRLSLCSGQSMHAVM